MERRTRQRDAILAALEESGAPLSPQEILKAAQPKHRGLGIATIYRAIRELISEKRLVPVELPGLPPRYELAGKDHHHHFECRDCGRVLEIEGCGVDLRKIAPRGLRVERHEIFLYGVCRACAG